MGEFMFTLFTLVICFGIPTLIWWLWTVLFGKKWRESWPNRRAAKIKYYEECWFSLGFHLFFALIIIVCLIAEPISTKTMILLSVFGLVYVGMWYLQIRKILTNKKKVRDGVKCYGKIVNIVKDRRYDRKSSDYRTSYKLKIEYYSPSKGELVQFVTPMVNVYPVIALFSVDIDVYEQKDGSAWATGFRQAKYNRDTLDYKGVELPIKVE